MIRRAFVTIMIALSVRNGLATDPLYLVIDLSAGSSATNYPVSVLDDVPSRGWTDEYKRLKLVLRRIEPGSFKMQNQYLVTLTKPFYIGVFEVTQLQWKLVMGTNPSYYTDDRRPVESVSYNAICGSSVGAGWPTNNAVDATSFLGKLRANTGLNFDLPSEAQWEYACRAGTTSEYNNGGSTEGDLNLVGRCLLNQDDCRGGYSYVHTLVGFYMPNAWGLYDMHGNVWEWCRDWYGDIQAGIDPKGPDSGWGRVLRGGGWASRADSCTSSSRYESWKSTVSNSDGFRICLTLVESAHAEASSESVPVDTTFVEGEKVGKSISVAYGAVDTTGCRITANGTQIVNSTENGLIDWTLTIAGENNLVYSNGGVVMTSTVSATDYMIMFDTNGGDSAPSPMIGWNGFKYGKLPNASREGHVFLGWFTSANGGMQIMEDMIVDSGRTLYAHWLPYGCTISQNGLQWDIVIAQALGSDGILTLDGDLLLSSSNEVVRFSWQPKTKGKHVLSYNVNGVTKKTVTVTVADLPFATPSLPNPPTAANAKILLKQTSHSFTAAGGTYSIPTEGVNGYAGDIAVSKSDDWITINSAEVNWKAGRSIVYSVAANSGVEDRIGYVYVSGHVHTITQAGVGAALSTYSADFESGGGENGFDILAGEGIGWNARPNVDWISISPTTGFGVGCVTFVVAPWNEVSIRTATITAAGETFTVKQTGRLMKLDKSVVLSDYKAQAVDLTVSALPFVEWDVASSVPWISIVDAGTGKGEGVLTFAVAENPSYLSRKCSLRIGSETVIISQTGRPSDALTFTLVPDSVAISGTGASGHIAVVATPGLPVLAQSKSSWIDLTVAPFYGVGDCEIFYVVAPNPDMSERSGTILVTPEPSTGLEAKTFKVIQSAATASISNPAHEFLANGETFEVYVSVLDIVKWRVTTKTDWVIVEGAETRTGPGVVRVTAKENLSIDAREATIIIAGHEFKISQSGRTVKIDPPVVGAPVDGELGAISVVADANVIWNANSSDMWINIWGDDDCDYDADGNIVDVGSGMVNYYIDGCEEGELPRTGWIQIGDKRVSILQTHDGVLVSVIDDPDAVVVGDVVTGFVVKPSEGKSVVEVSIPQGIDAAKVTVEVSPKVEKVKTKGVKVKVVNGADDITEFLSMPDADANGILDLTKATIKDEFVEEAMDVEKGAVIKLDAANPILTTPNTRKGLFYQLREGVTLGGMKDGDSTIGNGEPWSPKITVRGGDSGFYSIDVQKSE